jgi:hypothetical protein
MSDNDRPPGLDLGKLSPEAQLLAVREEGRLRGLAVGTAEHERRAARRHALALKRAETAFPRALVWASSFFASILAVCITVLRIMGAG